MPKVTLFLLLLVLPLQASAKVVISEVMWMGTDLSTADEWIELVAVDEEVDISGWTLTSRKSNGEEGVLFVFPQETFVSVGDYIVISNYDANGSRLDSEPDFVTTAVSLPNTKLLLRLRNASGSLMDEVDDGVGKPFAGANASGTGSRASMERIDLSGSGALKENWQTAQVSRGFDLDGIQLFGTPGLENVTRETIPDPIIEPISDPPPVEQPIPTPTPTPTPNPNPIPNPIPNPNPNLPVPSLRITEILANPIGRDDEEWFEVLNTGSGSVDLASISFATPTKLFALKATGSVLLEPNMYGVITKKQTGMQLQNGSGSLTVSFGDALLDRIEYPEAIEGISFGHTQDDDMQHFCIPTPGKINEDHHIDPQIEIQSGNTEGEESVSLNLQATLSNISLKSIACTWDYGDGFTSESCNPPSHTFREAGTYTIRLSVEAVCNQQHERTLTVTVLEKSIAKKNKKFEQKEEEDEKQEEEKEVCNSYTGTGLIISEFLPNPFGEESKEEWIELQNTTNTSLHICGWSIDDESEGSKQFEPYNITINPNTYSLETNRFFESRTKNGLKKFNFNGQFCSFGLPTTLR